MSKSNINKRNKQNTTKSINIQKNKSTSKQKKHLTSNNNTTLLQINKQLKTQCLIVKQANVTSDKQPTIKPNTNQT